MNGGSIAEAPDGGKPLSSPAEPKTPSRSLSHSLPSRLVPARPQGDWRPRRTAQPAACEKRALLALVSTNEAGKLYRLCRPVWQAPPEGRKSVWKCQRMGEGTDDGAMPARAGVMKTPVASGRTGCIEARERASRPGASQTMSSSCSSCSLCMLRSVRSKTSLRGSFVSSPRSLRPSAIRPNM